MSFDLVRPVVEAQSLQRTGILGTNDLTNDHSNWVCWQEVPTEVGIGMESISFRAQSEKGPSIGPCELSCVVACN